MSSTAASKVMLTSLFTIVLFPWRPVTAYEQLCGMLFTNKNLKLVGHVINTVNVSSNIKCADKCFVDSRCYSANYYHDNGTCELNKADYLTSPVSLRVHIHEGVEYMNNPDRNADRCYHGLCRHWPWQCIPEKTGEDFKCLPCEAANGTEFLWWPQKHVDRYIAWEKPFHSAITALTVSMWVKVAYELTNQETQYTPFSYASNELSDELTVSFSMNKTFIFLGGKQCGNIQRSVSHNRWHHVVVTWSSSHGDWTFFMDGVRVAKGNAKRGHVIKPGRLVLGQKQYGVLAYEVKHSFRGMLGNLNMWDKVLPYKSITGLMNTGCGSYSMTGNIIKWSSVKKLKRSRVHFYCEYPECTAK